MLTEQEKAEETIGQRIKKRRKELKLTLEEVAKLIDSGKSYVWELENKNIARPSAEKVQALAHALQTTVEYLLGIGVHPPVKTLWDEYAMAALTGILANPANGDIIHGNNNLDSIAAKYATKMMEERRKRNVS